jgi:hypothetical protein
MWGSYQWLATAKQPHGMRLKTGRTIRYATTCWTKVSPCAENHACSSKRDCATVVVVIKPFKRVCEGFEQINIKVVVRWPI